MLAQLPFSPAPPFVEHRGSPRYQFRVEIEIERNSKNVWGTVNNISREGMFIEIAGQAPVGSHFSGNLALNIPLHVECIVRRIVPRHGIGITFVIPEEQGRVRFEALLVALALGPTSASVCPETPNPSLPCLAATARK